MSFCNFEIRNPNPDATVRTCSCCQITQPLRCRKIRKIAKDCFLKEIYQNCAAGRWPSIIQTKRKVYFDRVDSSPFPQKRMSLTSCLSVCKTFISICFSYTTVSQLEPRIICILARVTKNMKVQQIFLRNPPLFPILNQNRKSLKIIINEVLGKSLPT